MVALYLNAELGRSAQPDLRPAAAGGGNLCLGSAGAGLLPNRVAVEPPAGADACRQQHLADRRSDGAYLQRRSGRGETHHLCGAGHRLAKR
ncbi:hypothetical protein D3C81_2136140 [compost metagenome]